MKLSEAKLCIDCETVFEGRGDVCPACGGKITWSLTKWCPSIVDTKIENAPAQSANGKAPWWARVPLRRRLLGLIDSLS